MIAHVNGQFADDFSDGDLSNPDWKGNIEHFTVNDDAQLQLNAPEAGNSNLYLPIMVSDSAIWEMWVKMDFAPSESNQLRMYLIKKIGSTDALYLKLGQNGTDDAIQLYQNLNGTETLLAETDNASIASGVEVRIQVTLIDGQGQLLVDLSGGHNYQLISDWESTIPIGLADFEIQCDYTATRKDKFYFDDLFVGAWLPDTAPPTLLFAEAETAQSILLGFDEPLGVSSENVDNFTIVGLGNPADVEFLENDSSKIVLFLSQDLNNGETYQVDAQNITDQFNNTGASSITFSYIVPDTMEAFDLVINEVFPDPNPSVGLPAKEFVELYNRSNKMLNLADVDLLVNTSFRTLPSYVLSPGEYVILAKEADTALWQPYGNVVGINLPALSNGGATIRLEAAGTIIHEMSYSLASYQNSTKKEGGWSLELINPTNPCLGEMNWIACQHLQGGTPGNANSVLDENFHESSVEIIQVKPVPNTSNQFDVVFDQSLGENATNVNFYHLEPNIEITTVTTTQNIARVTFASPLEMGQVYELTVNGVTNCLGESPLSSTVRLGIPEPVLAGDVVINELLFNPVTGGSDYVELLNISSKIVSFQGLAFMNFTKPDIIKPITASGLLFPNEYVAFTPDVAQVRDQYLPPDTATILKNLLPSMNDIYGNISLLSNGTLIDSVDYTKSMHHPLIYDESGVALERINPEMSTSRSNWISGTERTHYGTPGYQNAQFSLVNTTGSDYVETEQAIFSPNGDGFEDFVLFHYNLPDPGYVLNAQIYNKEGQFVYRLSNNDLLAQKGFIRWDGLNDTGSPVASGTYVVRFEFFNPEGDKVIALATCAVVW